MVEVEVTKWAKKIPTMTKAEIIKFQLMVHCHVTKVTNMSPALLDCLTMLGTSGSAELLPFCAELKDKGLFQSIQSSRNAITRLQDKGLIVKEGKSKKRIKINPELKIVNYGNILVDIKCFSPNATN